MLMECTMVVWKYKAMKLKKVHIFKASAIRVDGVSQQSHHHGRDMDFFNVICYLIRNDMLLYNDVNFLANIKLHIH